MELALYADDSALYSSPDKTEIVIVKIQNHLDKIRIWAQKWKILLNLSKSTTVLFTLRRPKNYKTLNLNGQNISWSHNLNILGEYKIKKLPWNPHISSKLLI